MTDDQEILAPRSSSTSQEIPRKETGSGYAIIGTRDPDEAQELIATQLAFAIAIIANQKVRTGAAYGIDQKAMEATGGKNLAVYLPWASYNRVLIPAGADIVVYSPVIHTSWTFSVMQYHPSGNRLSPTVIRLHARNYGIVHDCKAVIALPNERGEGGTGQGIRIARGLGIKILQANKGTVSDAPRWIAKALQDLGFASKELKPTILGGH